MAVEPFDVVDLIRTKRDKGTLSTEQITWLIDAYTRGYVADEQMSAMTMAIFLNGMSRDEIRDLTLAMIATGETLSFEGLGKPTTDKHSTGGVGDKITLPLAPLVASFGVTETGQITMTLTTGTIVSFGEPVDMRNKLVSLVVLLRRQDPNDLQTVDLSSGDPVVQTR
jgi:thymidine phosphorylase